MESSLSRSKIPPWCWNLSSMCRASHQRAVIMVRYYHSKTPLKRLNILHIQNIATDLLQCSTESTCARNVHHVSSLKWVQKRAHIFTPISMVKNYDEVMRRRLLRVSTNFNLEVVEFNDTHRCCLVPSYCTWRERTGYRLCIHGSLMF